MKVYVGKLIVRITEARSALTNIMFSENSDKRNTSDTNKSD